MANLAHCATDVEEEEEEEDRVVTKTDRRDRRRGRRERKKRLETGRRMIWLLHSSMKGREEREDG